MDRMVPGDRLVARRSRNRSALQRDGGSDSILIDKHRVAYRQYSCSGQCALVLDRVSKRTAATMSQIDGESASFRELVTQALGITNRQTCAPVHPMKAPEKSAGTIPPELSKD
jgi:hypothetical protein